MRPIITQFEESVHIDRKYTYEEGMDEKKTGNLEHLSRNRKYKQFSYIIYHKIYVQTHFAPHFARVKYK